MHSLCAGHSTTDWSVFHPITFGEKVGCSNSIRTNSRNLRVRRSSRSRPFTVTIRSICGCCARLYPRFVVAVPKTNSVDDKSTRHRKIRCRRTQTVEFLSAETYVESVWFYCAVYAVNSRTAVHVTCCVREHDKTENLRANLEGNLLRSETI